MPTPTGPVPGAANCQQINSELAALANAEILLLAKNDVAQDKLRNATSALETATHNARMTQMDLDANRTKQLELNAKKNIYGCP
jgi:hypothetical protein